MQSCRWLCHVPYESIMLQRAEILRQGAQIFYSSVCASLVFFLSLSLPLSLSLSLSSLSLSLSLSSTVYRFVQVMRSGRLLRHVTYERIAFKDPRYAKDPIYTYTYERIHTYVQIYMYKYLYSCQRPQIFCNSVSLSLSLSLSFFLSLLTLVYRFVRVTSSCGWLLVFSASRYVCHDLFICAMTRSLVP